MRSVCVACDIRRRHCEAVGPVVVVELDEASAAFAFFALSARRLRLPVVPGDDGDDGATGDRAQGERGAPPSCCVGESRWRRYDECCGEGVVGERGGVVSGDDDADSSGIGESDCVAWSSSRWY